MTTTTTGPGDVAELPSRDRHAQAPARAREDTPPAQPPTGAAAWLATRLPQLLAALLTGGSLWHTAPPSLAAIWHRHTASARYYTSPAARWARYGWGVIHIPFAAAAYLVAWLLHSFPIVAVAAAVVLAGHWLGGLPL